MIVELRTQTWGSGPKRLLMLHGVGSQGDDFWRLAPAIAEAGWTITAPDYRGHGRSPDGDGYLFADMVGDILALGSGWDAVHGHSMGGLLAVLAHTADRDWCRGIVLQDPALVLPEDVDEVFSWLRDTGRLQPTLESVGGLNPGWHERDVAVKVASLTRPGMADVEEACFLSNWPWNVLDEAVAVTVPMVVVGSDPDEGGTMPVAIGEWLAASSPLIEYRMLAGAPHSAHRVESLYRLVRDEMVGALARLPTLGGS